MANRSPRAVDRMVGQNIRIARLQMGLSQTDLGARIGVSFQQIQKYENGFNRIGASRLQQIADVLRRTVPALFDGAPTAHRPREQWARLLLTKPLALRLLLAFDQIKDEAARLAVLQVIENIAKTTTRSRSRNRNGG